MKDWFNFSLAWWHSLCSEGGDPFGGGTKHLPWKASNDVLEAAKAKLDAGFEFMQKIGINYYCFHDIDLIDEGNSVAEYEANLKAIVAYAKQTGLDQDPAVKRQLEQQQAQIYFQAIGKKRMADPTDAQLMAYYQERVAAMKAQGITGAVPPFEQVKAQVAEGWKQQRIATLTREIQQEVKAKVPVTLADEYRLPEE